MEFFLFGLAAAAVLVLLAPGMLPMVAVRLKLGTLLAADATTLAPAMDANEIALIVAPFTPGENLVIGDLTLGSTNGLTSVACATGTQEVGNDPVSGAQIITIVPGAGTGFRWLTSGSFSGPITIYGIALTTNAAAALLGVQPLAVPIVVSVAGQQVDFDPVQMVFVLQPLS